MSIDIRRAGESAVLDVSGDIDLASSPQMRKALLDELRQKRCPRVVLNLSKVTYIDSSGVASLLESLKASRELGSRLILFGLSGSAREVLQLSRLLQLFEVYETEAEALSV